MIKRGMKNEKAPPFLRRQISRTPSFRNSVQLQQARSWTDVRCVGGVSMARPNAQRSKVYKRILRMPHLNAVRGGDDCQNRGLWTPSSLPAALAWTVAAAEECGCMGGSLRVTSPAKACVVSSRRALGRPTVASLGRQALQPTTTCHASTP